MRLSPAGFWTGGEARTRRISESICNEVRNEASGSTDKWIGLILNAIWNYFDRGGSVKTSTRPSTLRIRTRGLVDALESLSIRKIESPKTETPVARQLPS